MSFESLLQILRQAGGQPRTEWIILVFQLNRVDAPKRCEINHVGFARKATAAVVPNYLQRFTSREPG
jgi:hypothetical protein